MKVMEEEDEEGVTGREAEGFYLADDNVSTQNGRQCGENDLAVDGEANSSKKHNKTS